MAAKIKTSIEQGRINAELYGATYDGSYCECVIGGEAHTVDLALIAGHSSLDHMADVPMAAAIEAIGGKEFASVKEAKKAAESAMTASLRGRPTIRLTFSRGTLAARWRADNEARALEAVRRALPGHMKHSTVAKVPAFDWYPSQDGRMTVAFTLTEDRYGTWGDVRVWADDICEPDTDIEVGEIRPRL